eukprot:249239_1
MEQEDLLSTAKPLPSNFLTKRIEIVAALKSKSNESVVKNQNYLLHEYGCYEQSLDLFGIGSMEVYALEKYVDLCHRKRSWMSYTHIFGDAYLILYDQRYRWLDTILMAFCFLYPIGYRDKAAYYHYTKIVEMLQFGLDCRCALLACLIQTTIPQEIRQEQIDIIGKSDISEITQTIMNCTPNDIRRKGVKILFDHDSIEACGSVNYCRAEYESKINKKYNVAKKYYIKVITQYVCDGNNKVLYLMDRVVGLIGLSENCEKNGEYAIGKRLLYAVKKITKGYFLHSFVNNDYERYRSRFVKKLRNMKCASCGTSYQDKKLKVCTLCMQTFYCNKKCQKIHWIQHKQQCNASWKDLYHVLKLCIFDVLS